MISALIRWSLRFPVVVCLLAAILAVWGMVVLARARYDVFPEFVPPQASVQTEAPGMVAEQVEQLVTLPIERTILGAAGVETVRSETISGLSVVTVIFREGGDPYRSRQVVAEALGELAGVLPAGVHPPRITPLVSSTMDLTKLGFVSDRLSPMQLRDLVQWTVRPRLLAVPGVARATLYGGEERELQVLVDPRELLARDLTLADVIATARAATGVRGGGFIDTPNQRVLIETRAQTLTPEALAAAIVPAPSGSPLALRDFTRVQEGGAPRFGDTLIMGRAGVLLGLSGQYGANTLEVTRAVEAALEELRPGLAARGVSVHPGLHRPANFIENALAGVRLDVLVGIALITAVLFVFMRDFTSVAVAFITIPLALLAAVIVIDALGWTINTMTLGGLAVALGVVVDDAIIDVENIVRRLRAAAPGSDLRAVVHGASFEVRSPVVYATFVVALVLAPMLLLSGLQGSFFRPLAAAFILATLASLGVALTVTPAAAWLLLTRHRQRPEPAWLQRLKAAHERWLAQLTERPRALAAAALCLAGLAACAVPFFDSELMPPFREGHFVVQAVGPPGSSLEAMREIGTRVSRDLLALPGVASVEQTLGRAELGEDTWETNRSEFHVELRRMSGRAEERTQAAMRELMTHYPQLQSEVLTFLGDRLSESLSGETAAIAVNIFGPELETLDAVAGRVLELARAVPGATDVQRRSQPGAPVVRVEADYASLARFGVSAADLLDAVQTAYAGAVATQVYDGNRVVNVVVRLPEPMRRDPEAIGALLVRGASGATLPLSRLARITAGEVRTGIQHEGARRREVVSLNAQGSDVPTVLERVRAAVRAKLVLPPGVYIEYAGAAEGLAAARREVLLHSLAAAVGIVLLLSVAFGSWRSVALILAMTPFALVGGVLAVALTGATLSIGSLVGFVTLFGIAARNSILVLAHLAHLTAQEGAQWSRATVLRGTRERVTPILLTALVTALGLLPLALGSGETGREVQGPMALVILGGLASSTLMNLLLLPALAWRFGPFSARAGAQNG